MSTVLGRFVKLLMHIIENTKQVSHIFWNNPAVERLGSFGSIVAQRPAHIFFSQ